MQNMRHSGPDLLFAISPTPLPCQKQTGLQIAVTADLQTTMLIHKPLHVGTASITPSPAFLVLHFDS